MIYKYELVYLCILTTMVCVNSLLPPVAADALSGAHPATPSFFLPLEARSHTLTLTHRHRKSQPHELTFIVLAL